MNCIEIIEKWLKENGFDGLVCIEEACGCGFKDDTFFACGEPDNIVWCQPAYRKKMMCEKDCDPGYECYDPDGKEKWCYSLTKGA